MANPPASRTKVIDLIVTVFSHSDARTFVGTDALRTVLEGRYREITYGGILKLGELWELLSEQPGFTPDAVIPPICTIKTWERQLGMPVKMPDVLDGMSDTDIADEAKKSAVPASAIKKLLEEAKHEGKTADKARKSQAREAQKRATGSHSAVSALSPKLIGAALVAVISFGFAAFTLGNFVCSSPKFKAVEAPIAGSLPIEKAKRLGDQVGARLTDTAWLSKDRSDRQAQLAQALESLGADVHVLYLTSDNGAVVASVQRTADGLKYRFAK